MAQKKAHEVDGWLARPDRDIPVVLIYGPDRGLVSERARVFARKTGLPLDDPFTVVRIDAADADQQGRLLDEARTVPMFAERRLVWVRGAAGHSALAADVAALIADPPADSVVLIEAGDLKKSAALRTAVERGPTAMALPCYADDGRGIDTVIDEVLAAGGLSIALDARQLLKANLGGDRLASRGELEKLALYCAGAGEVSAEDVLAVIGDVSRLSADDAVDAVLCGNIAAFDTLFTRHLASGSPPFLVLSAALRQVQALQLMREQVDRQSKTPAAAVASARPPVFFTRRRAVEQALQRWNQAMLQAAANRLHGAILKSRQHPAVAEPLSRQALLALAIEGARAAR
ncbi:DNA polymerase III subunit delta [Chelativorans xinjiangense]|uniref:DNA polymerase III subunit delta n=1 Tax=Chelativorans xinjiangense TaxID=2681485 RepID=UPI001359F7FE|nr:DNA polymerase III subunit delta [Chelativorans xinjiangense]